MPALSTVASGKQLHASLLTMGRHTQLAGGRFVVTAVTLISAA